MDDNRRIKHLHWLQQVEILLVLSTVAPKPCQAPQASYNDTYSVHSLALTCTINRPPLNPATVINHWIPRPRYVITECRNKYISRTPTKLHEIRQLKSSARGTRFQDPGRPKTNRKPTKVSPVNLQTTCCLAKQAALRSVLTCRAHYTHGREVRHCSG